MPYQVTKTPIEGVLVLEPKVFGDARGFFFESFNARDFEQATGLKETFVQDNHSKSANGVLRGLHYQVQHAQGKWCVWPKAPCLMWRWTSAKTRPRMGNGLGWSCLPRTKSNSGCQQVWPMVFW